jgi:hypothetical protein
MTTEELKKEHEPNAQLAENEDIEIDLSEKIDGENGKENYEDKRKLLDITKINKQIWSIKEIYQKINTGKLILDPEYQRREVWSKDKKIPFIESLFMGITIPPIYVVEIPTDDFLAEMSYEVVDGKQRLTAIKEFISNELTLEVKFLEYYGDLFDKKKFIEIQNENGIFVRDLLSSVLDVYVISANSPEFTKYDIFSRLNKGAQSLRTNEIRKAVYRSKVIETFENYIEPKVKSEDAEYFGLFSKKLIERYEDYGVFFGAITYVLKTDFDQEVVLNYNSRPRELINTTLGELQEKPELVDKDRINLIIEKTIFLKKALNGKPYEKYLLDSMIYFAVNDFPKLNDKFEEIIADKDINETFVKSPATTSNVNKRLKRIKEMLYE